ncbi:MAG: ornithine cyclodeaminase family protein, partial [Rhizobiales bacterium]|nr:ornithine cyclodeaminase family protein [Hyphomicrobiales bacterium]
MGATNLRIVTADDIHRALDYGALIDALAAALRVEAVSGAAASKSAAREPAAARSARPPAAAPKSVVYRISQPSGDTAVMSISPAWNDEGARFIGCRIATTFPVSAAQGQRPDKSCYVLMSGDSGETLAAMDGAALSAVRVAAMAALAARHLAREDAAHLLVIGAGLLGPHFVRAHRAVRPIERVTLWSRTRSRAIATAFALSAAGIEPTIADDLQAAVGEADIVSCATRAQLPVLRGAWLKKGVHVDLAGALESNAREADDAVMRRARVYVDSRLTAPKVSGDIAIP